MKKFDIYINGEYYKTKNDKTLAEQTALNKFLKLNKKWSVRVCEFDTNKNICSLYNQNIIYELKGE